MYGLEPRQEGFPPTCGGSIRNTVPFRSSVTAGVLGGPERDCAERWHDPILHLDGGGTPLCIARVGNWDIPLIYCTSIYVSTP